MKNYYNLSVEEIEKELNTNKEGLSGQEYDLRIEKYGFNELTEKKKESILVKFIEQFKDMMVLVLIIASIISGIIDLSHGEGLTNTMIILAIVIVNAVIGVIQEVRAEKSLEALKKLTQHEAKVIRDRKSYNSASKNAYSR
jgi:calcium-translocating P-type ATPase, PMCA-type